MAAQRRFTRRLALCLAVLVCVGAGAGAATVNQTFDTVTAKKLLITDADGKVRIKLEAPLKGANGDAKLVILSPDGGEVAGIGQYKDVAVLWSRLAGGDNPSVDL